MKNKKIEKILIPTDYSPNAKRAMGYGAEMAKRIGAEILLFHSYHSQAISPDDITILEKIKRDENERMEKLVEELSEEYGGLLNISGRAEFGSAVDWIDSLVETEKIDLVVMGTKGENEAFSNVFGSVASHAINEVNCSVLVIPQDVRRFEINEVLFATDFHPTESLTYKSALLNLLREYDPNVQIVNFQKNLDLTTVPTKGELQTDNIFNEFKHSFHYIEDENVEQGIYNFVEENHCDLIVILTKHYNLWQRIFHRSIARKLALHSKVPLLIMHDDD